MRRTFLVSLGVLSLVCGAQIVSAVPYFLADLGPIAPDTASFAYSVAVVNGTPLAAGKSINGGGPTVWTASGTATSLLSSIPGATTGVAEYIATNGDTAGYVLIGGAQKAFYLPHGGSATILPDLGTGTPASFAWAVSTTGTAVGYSYSGTYQTFNDFTQQWETHDCPNACVWSGGTVVNLGAPGVPTYATGISADGNTIIGDYNNTPNQLGQAVKWTRSGSTWTMTPLVQKSQYNQTVPYSINSSGDVVGGCFDYPDGGFPNVSQIALEFKHDGSIVRIGGLAASMPTAYARGINDSGVIVGYDGFGACFVNYTGTPDANINLTTLLAPNQGTGWSLSYVYGIDNNGDIVGRGTEPMSGKIHGFLLKPAMAGDATLDGTVDVSDLSAVLTNYDKTGSMAWGNGDFNGDGTVALSDLSNVLTNYNKSMGSSAVRAVPEPSTVVLAALALVGLAVGLLRRSRR